MSDPNHPYQPYDNPWPPRARSDSAFPASPAGAVYGTPPPAPRRQRRWIIPTVIAALAVIGMVGAVLVLRGGDTTNAATPVAGLGTSARADKPAKKIGYGTPARIVAAALGCTKIHPTPAAAPDDIDMGSKPDDSILCTFDGEAVQVSTWKTASGQSESLAAAKLLVTGFGLEVYLARGDGWVAGLDGDAVKPEADRKVAEAIAAKLSGKVLHWTST